MKNKSWILFFTLFFTLCLTISVQLNRNTASLEWIHSQNSPISNLNTKVNNLNLGTETRANSNSTADQEYPDVCCFSDGSYVVVWQHTISASDTDIYFRIFESDGTPRTGDSVVNTAKTGYQKFPQVSCVNSSYFVVVWEDEADLQIKGRVY